jgi:hypothetical protein
MAARDHRMATDFELGSLGLRYESFRLKQPALEKRLLSSIAQRGIEEPLDGVDLREAKVFLNGFKGYRCARKLRLRGRGGGGRGRPTARVGLRARPSGQLEFGIIDGEPQILGQPGRASVEVLVPALARPDQIRVRAVPFGFARYRTRRSRELGGWTPSRMPSFVFPMSGLLARIFLACSSSGSSG